MANGTRTHDNWNHNPGLYQLSYSHQQLQIKEIETCYITLYNKIITIRPTGFEPVKPLPSEGIALSN